MAPLTVSPPSPQEVQRKLSVRSVARSIKASSISAGAPVSGTESDSDSILTPDYLASSGQFSAQGLNNSLHGGTSLMQPPLSSIAERRSGSGEDSDEEEEEEGGWKSADLRGEPRDSVDESVIKSGYLWKKGERRKTWKKRWFVLRPAHLAYYKSSAEYQLLRLLELSDVHSCTQVALKKHENTFGLVSPIRTFYLQAQTPGEVQDWIWAIEEARQTLMATSTQNSTSSPIPIPRTPGRAAAFFPTTPSPRSHPSHAHNVTSSDSDDVSPVDQRSYLASSQNRLKIPSSPSKAQAPANKDLGKIILSGYLMKCGSKRRNWRKRWFVLTGEKLIYSGSHMDTKPHRQFSFSEILDALEYDLLAHRHNSAYVSPSVVSPLVVSAGSDADESQGAHTFKIVTTKRTLLLCAPTEEDEIRWLGAVHALIARRSGVGAVPGELSKQVNSSQSADNNTASGISTGGNVGVKSKSRRPSATGPSVLGGGIIPEEDAEEKQP